MRRVLFWGMLVLFGVGVVWAATTKPDVPRYTQKDYHKLATTSPHGTFSRYPKVRKVVNPPVDTTYLQLAIEYAKGSVTRAPMVAGKYDNTSRTVTLLNPFVRAETTMPDSMRTQFLHTLRHEYGHAFAEDMLQVKYARKKSGGQQYLAYTDAAALARQDKAPTNVPAALKPVVADWRDTPADIYGLSHNTDSFGEYLAESYARYMDGDEVPTATRAFLKSQSQSGAGLQ